MTVGIAQIKETKDDIKTVRIAQIKEIKMTE